ncbi:hypothetical protein MUN89_03375 [Halobacillus salinarum]|uniref:beta-mannosidase n=1 Tax=Halobacillus salinarum TaxID=2932257 RepID=A0ABY4EKL1_9BACI|nr:sugar-binding domain-containing protein [Halobacillus salinarum]UOQ45007.1 hypothetical protein MUN89_03375 [Halobacillus salinarum]
MNLSEGWKLHDVEEGKVSDLTVADPDYIDHYWMKAEVPGDVHSTLLARNLIEDPFFGHNDLKCKWVEDKTWWYRKEFIFFRKDHPGTRQQLTFEGLDTFATIYVNGVELGSTENMFIAHHFDVTRELREGRNVIAVKFASVAERVKEKEKNYWAGFGKDRIWTRKAQYHFGWDWGPQIVTCGIWRDVLLETKQEAEIENVYARTREASKEAATIQVDVVTSRLADVNEELSLTVLVKGKEKTDSYTVEAGRDGRTTVQLDVANPELWWTHDLGDPFLYELEVLLAKDDAVLDHYNCTFGIRELELKQKDDEGNERFTFVLNGVELFAKGANWIPVDSFPGSVPDSRYNHLIGLAKEANMNMLRVWGGGSTRRISSMKNAAGTAY